MKSLVEKLQQAIEIESSKLSQQRDFREIGQLIEKLDQLGLSNRRDYTFPQVDTLGKRIYGLLNGK
jgi:hypothetical protein